jgi:hypothetical protein
MIRRGFWLAAGAVLGVTGYRRVSRLARVLTVPRATARRSLPGTGPTAGPQMVAPRARPRSQVARTVAAAKFVRDVRDGMAEYLELHRGEPDQNERGRTLEGRTLETQSYRTLSSVPARSGPARSGPAGSGESQRGRRKP